MENINLIISTQEKVTLQIAEEMKITDPREFKFAFAIVSKMMEMYEDNGAEELLEQIQDLTEEGDFFCSTCDHVNALIKDR